MDTRRVVVALVLALILSGVTYFIFMRLRGPSAAGPQTRKVVAAAHPLSPGMGLKTEDVTLIDWPTNLPLTGSFSEAQDVVGRALLYPLGDKEPIQERDLAVPGAGIGLTTKIPLGMRAVAVRSNEIVGVAGFLFPGSRVDVLATLRPPGGGWPITQIVLQNVEVLTAGQKFQPDPQGKAETVSVVTLLLSPEDSERLILASSQASIQFVLRSGADSEKIGTRPVSLDELVSGVRKPAPAVRPTRVVSRVAAQAPPKPPEFYSVEVIHGERRTIEKFAERPE